MRRYAPLLVAASILFAGAGCTGSTNIQTTPSATTKPAVYGSGRAVFGITDAADSLGDVSAVIVTIDKIEVHGANADWKTVSTGTKSYDLVALKASGATQLLADANLDAGIYDQVRLNITKVTVTAGGKTETAVLPSNSLKIVGQISVVSGETTSVVFDFAADKSVHKTGNGTYIVAPVVTLTVDDHVAASVNASEEIKIDGGERETDETVGQDETGETRVDFELPDTASIDATGHIKIGE